MTYDFHFLSENDTRTLYQTFMTAFADYSQDISHITETYFTNRAIKNGVDHKTSVGVFDQGEMVGFTLVAMDQFNGSYSAFDAFTGIVKPHRGQGLAKGMLEFIVPKLKAKGVETFYLEVLQDNEPAVRAYEKTGFTITRELDAFSIDWKNAKLNHGSGKNIEIHPITKAQLDQAAKFMDWQPSWENSLASLHRIPDEAFYLGAFIQGNLIGVLVHYPLLNWILCLAVHKSFRRLKVGTALLAHLKDTISSQFPSTRIINVEHTDQGMIKFLESVGFTFIGNQFEMKLDISETA
jgi:ribosomal protein S18 acetylase RimI-like enzyme